MTTLKFLRLMRMMNQTRAAELAGISLSQYSLVESGRLKPTDTTKKRLSKAFGKPAEELLKPIILESVV